jgi:taurine dioxygenase
MSFEIKQLSEVCGAEVVGLDMRRALDSADLARLEDAFDRHRVLLFRNQPLSARELANFSGQFGALQVHVQRAYQHPEVPEVVQMTNRKADGTYDEVGAARGAATRTRDGWHSDLSFDPKPAKATLLHSVEIPSRGGNTCFSNTTAAYAALPEKLKRRLDGLTAEFVYGQARRNKLAAKAAEALDADAKAKTVAVHPVVSRHPKTGEPGIFLNPYTAQRIIGLPEDESEALIETLTDQIEDEAFRWEHQWGVGDTLMWDNRLNENRRFIRTTVMGDAILPFRLAS